MFYTLTKGKNIKVVVGFLPPDPLHGMRGAPSRRTSRPFFPSFFSSLLCGFSQPRPSGLLLHPFTLFFLGGLGFSFYFLNSFFSLILLNRKPTLYILQKIGGGVFPSFSIRSVSCSNNVRYKGILKRLEGF